MIMISSPAGQRLAKIGFRIRALSKESVLPKREHYINAEREYDAAVEAVIDELIADNHHTGEGD